MKTTHILCGLAGIGIALILAPQVILNHAQQNPPGLTTEQHKEREAAADRAYADALDGWTAWGEHIRRTEAEMEQAPTPGAVAYLQRRIAGMEEERDKYQAKMDKAQRVKIRSKLMQEHGGQFMPAEYADPAIDEIDLN